MAGYADLGHFEHIHAFARPGKLLARLDTPPSLSPLPAPGLPESAPSRRPPAEPYQPPQRLGLTGPPLLSDSKKPP